MGLSRGWSRELWLTAIALVIGLAGMPALIFYTGASLLGRYEGASAMRIYQSVYGGLKTRLGGLLDRDPRALRPVSDLQGPEGLVAGSAPGRPKDNP